LKRFKNPDTHYSTSRHAASEYRQDDERISPFMADDEIFRDSGVILTSSFKKVRALTPLRSTNYAGDQIEVET
jgi:hypothetical protein